VSLGEVNIWIFRFLLLVNLIGYLEDLIFKILWSVTVSGLVLSLEVENKDPVQETFELSWSGLIFLIAMWPLYVGYRVIRLPLLVITLGGARLIQVAQLLILLLVFGIEGRLLNYGVFVGDCQHLLRCPGILHGALADQRRVLQTFLEEHDD
jgi:hypothetical protein